MKIEKLETHDRLEHFKNEQSINIFQGAEDCLLKNPLSLQLQEHSSYIYMFAHPRTEENGDKCMYWQPRLSKPKAQYNSYLFRAKSNTNEIEVCWLLPPRALWPEYQKGNLLEHELVTYSIEQFNKNKKLLETPEIDDVSDEKGKQIYRIVKRQHNQMLKLKKEETEKEKKLKSMDNLWLPNHIRKQNKIILS